MKVRFLKEHLKNSKGDVTDIEEGIASYLLILGVVERHGEKKEIVIGKEKKVFTKTKEKRQIQ